MLNLKPSKKVLFVLPIVVLLVTRAGIELFVQLLKIQLKFAWIPSFIVYYCCIECCIFFSKKKLAIDLPSRSFKLFPFPKINVFLVGLIIPALLPLGFFLLNIRAVPYSFLAIIILFACINPFFEESFWRGLLSFLPINNKLKMFYSAFLFSFMHYFLWGTYWLTNPPAKWIAAVITTFIMGMLWMWFLHKDKRLVFPILSHVAVDILNLSVAMFYGIKLITV